MTYDDLAYQTDLSKVELPKSYAATVINTVTAVDQSVYVSMQQMDTEDAEDFTPVPQRVGPVEWSMRGADFPHAGDEALISFADDGTPWLVEWKPSSPTPIGTPADASTTVKGITKVSVAPVLATNPIAVGDNDPRNTNARTPLAHVHPESDVTNLVTDLAAKEATANKGANNGYAPLDSAGKLPAANLQPMPRVLLTRTTTQPLNTSSITAVSWSTASDAGGATLWVVGNPTVITIPEDGWYAITAGLLFNNTSGDHDLFLAQATNSGNRFAEDNGNEAEVAYRNIALVRHFPAAFALSLFAFQNSGANNTMGGTSEQTAHLSITKLAA